MSSKNNSKQKEFDVGEHLLVPKHVLLSKEEAEQVLATYRVRPYQLPTIKASDPAIKHLNAKLGDIIKVIRKSPTAGEAVYYRHVIDEHAKR